jgi:putative tricarboxylic transport membrane protein
MGETLSCFLLGLSQVFTASTFALMLVGIAIGFAVGILPGLGGPTALALMLPFIVKMSPVEAFAFLLGMSAVTNTTGDITSILVGIPGEPTTAATIVDGHPMAKKGEAGRALGAVLSSSLVGALFGAFGLAVAVPVIRPLVLKLGSPEFFMLAVLGITFVASLSGEAPLKGLISGGIGLFLATVGMSSMSGIQRYTLGQTFLWDGIGLVPITIGFFAIPEIVDLAIAGTSIAKEEVGKIGGVMEGVKDCFRHWWLVIRCSAIGTFCAIVPGLGGATTQWLAYAHAVQSSPERSRFGKGAVEGVLGPGAANNSTLGGSLLTTVAFGVPASVLMAILLGAFLIHGIIPGPDMLRPDRYLSLTFSFVWINVISNILTVALCFLVLRYLVKVTQIRGSIIIPFILLLIYLGAFAEKNMFEDLILVLFFGCLGWVLQQVGWPRPPLILGLVLGPLAEDRLFLSVDNYGTAWLTRPGVLLLSAIILFGIFYPVYRKSREKRGEPGQPATPTITHRRRLTGSTLFGGFIVVIFGVALWRSLEFNFRAGLFPWVVGSMVLIVAVAQLIFDFVRPAAVEEGADNTLTPGVRRKRTFTILGWIFGYFFSIWLAGFTVGGPLCAFVHFKFGSREKWLLSIALTLAAFVVIYVLFERLLHVPFRPGSLMTWLSVD